MVDGRSAATSTSADGCAKKHLRRPASIVPFCEKMAHRNRHCSSRIGRISLDDTDESHRLPELGQSPSPENDTLIVIIAPLRAVFWLRLEQDQSFVKKGKEKKRDGRASPRHAMHKVRIQNGKCKNYQSSPNRSSLVINAPSRHARRQVGPVTKASRHRPRARPQTSRPCPRRGRARRG